MSGAQWNIWLTRHNIIEFCRQSLGDIERRRFTQVVDVGFECQSHAGNLRFSSVFVFKCERGIFDLFDDPFALVVIYTSGGLDQTGCTLARIDDEPRIDGDAVPPYATSGLEDVDARVTVGQADEIEGVDTELIAQDAELVGKCDVDITEAVFSEFGHLGGLGIGFEHFALDKSAVKLGGCLGRFGGDAADDPVVFDEFTHDMAGEDAFGAVGDEQF